MLQKNVLNLLHGHWISADIILKSDKIHIFKNIQKPGYFLKWLAYFLFLLQMCVYRVSQEEGTKLRESVPYVKIYRYNPKHLYPKLNGYGDNGQRKVLTSCISAYCTSSAVSSLTLTEQYSRHLCECTSSAQRDKSTSLLPICTVFGNPKDTEIWMRVVFVVQFNGSMSLTS